MMVRLTRLPPRGVAEEERRDGSANSVMEEEDNREESFVC